MTLRKKITSALGLALLPAIPPLLLRGILLCIVGLSKFSDLNSPRDLFDTFSGIDQIFFVGSWAGVGLFQLFFAWPFSESAYLKWLKASPWKPGKTLPKGGLLPSRWLWISILISSAAGTLAFGLSPLLPAIGFGSGWLAVAVFIAFKHLAIGQPLRESSGGWIGLLPTTALSSFFVPWPLPWAFGCLAVSVYFLHRHLFRLLDAAHAQLEPWTAEPRPACHHGVWLQPDVDALIGKTVSKRGGFIIAIVFGIVSACVVALQYRDEATTDGGGVFFTCLVVITALSKLKYYRGALQPPISWWGRLRSGPLLIPAYDRMMLPALTAIIIAPASLVAIRFLPSGGVQVLVLAMSQALAMAIIFCTGPDFKTWLLTAPGRMGKSQTNAKANVDGKIVRAYSKI